MNQTYEPVLDTEPSAAAKPPRKTRMLHQDALDAMPKDELRELARQRLDQLRASGYVKDNE